MSIYDLPNELLGDIITDAPTALMVSMTARVFNRVYPRIPWQKIMQDAATHGYTPVVEFMYATGCKLSKKVMSAAVVGGHLETVKWLHLTGCRYAGFVCEDAAQHGHLDVLKFLHSVGKPLTGSVMNGAVYNNSVNIIEWLMAADCDYYVGTMYETAAESGSIDVLNWLGDKFPGWKDDRYISYYAVRSGRINTLKYLVSNGFACDWKRLMSAAVESNNIQMVIHVYENGGELCPFSYRNAIFRGNIEILQWLIDRECPQYTDACKDAALHKHVHILELLGATGRCTCKRTHSHANGHTKLVGRVRHRLRLK